MGDLGTWIPIWGQFRVPCMQERRGKAGSTLSTLPSFLPGLCLGSALPLSQPGSLALSCTLHRAPAPRGCHSNPVPAGPPSARCYPRRDGGRPHPAPPDLRPQLLVSPDFAGFVPGCVGGDEGTTLGEWSHLGVTFMSPSFWGHTSLPAPEGHEVLGWVVPPAPSVLVSPGKTPHLHPKQG